MTGVEKHAQAILDARKSYKPDFDWIGKERDHWISRPKDIQRWWDGFAEHAAEAVLVAARDHDTRQAEVIALLEAIERRNDYSTPLLRRNEDHQDAVAALRLLRGGDG